MENCEKFKVHNSSANAPASKLQGIDNLFKETRGVRMLLMKVVIVLFSRMDIMIHFHREKTRKTKYYFPLLH